VVEMVGASRVGVGVEGMVASQVEAAKGGGMVEKAGKEVQLVGIAVVASVGEEGGKEEPSAAAMWVGMAMAVAVRVVVVREEGMGREL
jgi:hypothetical protein